LSYYYILLSIKYLNSRRQWKSSWLLHLVVKGVNPKPNEMGDSNSQQQDPYDFLFSHSQITSSQEQLLRDLSLGPHSQHSRSPSTPPASAHSPDTVPQDAFHTPPENISLPSFCDQLRAATEGHVHAGTQGFVDLGMDSGLGLSEMGVGECSHGARRDALSEMDEGPVKESKLSEGDLGIDSSGGCVEVQSQKVEEEGVGNSEGNLVSEEEKISDENNCSAENLETIVGNVGLCESEKVACTVEGSRSSDGVVEDWRLAMKR